MGIEGRHASFHAGHLFRAHAQGLGDGGDLQPGTPWVAEDPRLAGTSIPLDACPLRTAEGALLAEALETARAIAGNAPISVRQAKKSINASEMMDLKNGYDFEIEAYNRTVPTEDRLEGVRAFNEKRKPVYKGR